MRHSTRRILRMGTGWILVWTVLVVVPPLALAGSLPGYYGIRPPQRQHDHQAHQRRHGDGVLGPLSGDVDHHRCAENTGPCSRGNEQPGPAADSP
jgi:hypothetical protein